MALPDPVVTAIVRGMAAYMQAARPTDLPVALRPLRGKHMKMLSAHRRDILSALDDETLRALVLDWLDDKPTGITKADAAILRTAVVREGQWEDALAGDAPEPTERQAPTADLAAALQREKERTRRAKDEARRAKQQIDSQVAEERKKVVALTAQVDGLTRMIAELEGSLSAAQKEADSARTQMDREVRKARRSAEKAVAALEASKATVKGLRSDISRLKAAVPRPSSKSQPPRTPAAPDEPTRRRRLSAPKGRFEDDPETLSGWLTTPLVRLLVDGYNVSKAEGGFGDLELEAQRERLLQGVGKIARRHKIKATVIFDGSDVAPGTARRARGPVEVEYSRAAEIADDHLIAKLEGLPKHPVIVATNDRELQRRAARLGATIATSNQLLELIR